MNRRSTVVAAIVAVVVMGGSLVLRSVAAAPPNIVLIIADDQAWTDYGFMGHARIQTPNLDRLATESLTFTHGYVPSSLCRPSLATIITGLYPHQHKLVGNDPAPLVGVDRNAAQTREQEQARRAEMIEHIDDVATLPRLLAQRGFVSFQSGKWWEGSYRRAGFTEGMTRGFPAPGGRHGDDGLTDRPRRAGTCLRLHSSCSRVRASLSSSGTPLSCLTHPTRLPPGLCRNTNR